MVLKKIVRGAIAYIVINSELSYTTRSIYILHQMRGTGVRLAHRYLLIAIKYRMRESK